MEIQKMKVKPSDIASEKPSKLDGLTAWPQKDTYVNFQKPCADGGGNLVDATKMFTLNTALCKQAEKINEIYAEAGYNTEVKVVGPYRLKEGTNAEIFKKLSINEDDAETNVSCTSKSKEAAALFKERTLELLFDLKNQPSAKRVPEILNKIGQIFQNAGLSKVLYIGMDHPCCNGAYLVGISKDKQMIAISTYFSE